MLGMVRERKIVLNVRLPRRWLCTDKMPSQTVHRCCAGAHHCLGIVLRWLLVTITGLDRARGHVFSNKFSLFSAFLCRLCSVPKRQPPPPSPHPPADHGHWIKPLQVSAMLLCSQWAFVYSVFSASNHPGKCLP